MNIDSGLKVSYVLNKNEAQCRQLICCICLEIAVSPFECTYCEVFFCEICIKLLKLASKECVRAKCSNTVKRANKFVREILENLIVNCEHCKSSTKFKYNEYVEHLKTCEPYLKNEIYSLIIKADEADKNITNQINEKEKILRTRTNRKLNSISPIKNKSEMNISITTNLPIKQKMEIYNCTVEGRVNDLIVLINEKKYPLFEEISAVTFNWTALHYAMHYGKEDVMYFIMDFCLKNNCINKAMNLRSSDGRCPLLCLVKSNTLDTNKKKELLKKILKTFPFRVTDDCVQEIENRQLNNILAEYRPDIYR